MSGPALLRSARPSREARPPLCWALVWEAIAFCLMAVGMGWAAPLGAVQTRFERRVFARTRLIAYRLAV